MAFYKDGIISIPNVTGDVVITATAAQSAPINLLDVYGYTEGQRLSLSSGNNSSASGAVVIGADTQLSHLIPVSPGDVFRIKTDTSLPTAQSTKWAYCVYDSNGDLTTGSDYIYSTHLNSDIFTGQYDSTNKILTLTANSSASSHPYVRFCFEYADIGNVVITKNQ